MSVLFDMVLVTDILSILNAIYNWGGLSYVIYPKTIIKTYWC